MAIIRFQMLLRTFLFYYHPIIATQASGAHVHTTKVERRELKAVDAQGMLLKNGGSGRLGEVKQFSFHSGVELPDTDTLVAAIVNDFDSQSLGGLTFGLDHGASRDDRDHNDEHFHGRLW